MPKIKSHICKNLKEFLKIQRKYIKYLCLRKYHKLWYIWITVDILDPSDKHLIWYANKLKKQGYPNLSYILKEIQDNYGWEFISKQDGLTYTLTGIEITNEDYYYLFCNKETGAKKYMTCVGDFKDTNLL